MSEIGNQILTRFDKVEPVLGEAFPWKAHELFYDVVVDAGGQKVASIWGYFGQKDPFSPGTAERRRMILELPNLVELVREVAYGIHYCPREMVETARKIMARIEGRTA